MVRTTSDTDLRQDPILDPSGQRVTQSVAAADLNILPPPDFRRDARFVAARMAVLRHPPALAIAPSPLTVTQVPHGKPGENLPAAPNAPSKWGSIVAEGFSADLESLASLEPDLLAWRVTEMSARLADNPRVAGRPEAVVGLRRLEFQALLFRHLQILKSAAAEGSA
jgi:hypothetical protein